MNTDIHVRKSRTILAIFWVSAMALFFFNIYFQAWNINLRSLSFVYAEDPTTLINGDFEYETTIFPSVGGETDDCYKLWQSRETANRSLEEAKQILASISACSRQDQIAYLAGELAWKLGDTRQAQESWSMLNDNQLAGLIISNSRSGEIDVEKILLDLLLTNGREKNLSPALKVEMYSQAAKMARSKGDDNDAVWYFYLAWEASGQNYLQSYYLGKLYFDLGRYEDAVQILEIGLEDRLVLSNISDFKTIFQRAMVGQKTFGSMDKVISALSYIGTGEKYYLIPDFDFSYLATLIDCSNRLQDKRRSWMYINEARIILNKEGDISQEALDQQKRRLDRMISEARMIE